MEDLARKIAAAGKIRLRFDKVVLRVVRDLRATLDGKVPKSVIVVVTMTAPIKLPSKTEAALATKIETLLSRRSHKEDWQGAVLSNLVRIRVLSRCEETAERIILLVHNDAADAVKLLDQTEHYVFKEP